ncbi:MAG: oxygen-independent coproporphyrinogen III oxidase [Lachnospiraceae bacterium]|nr:oxygen-independent coproporphyrinogen III oxidase [Lachnospiraceae bacterium]
MKKLGLYIHIPFCVKKCNYCDFLSAPSSKQVQIAYMDTLQKEIEEKAIAYKDWCVDTIFIGGGTPTSVPYETVVKMMDTVRAEFCLDKDCEITIECNPGTVTSEALKAYRAAGINRLSIGLQSADDELLKELGRIHTYEQFLETYTWARKAGFENINVDVMSGLPGQTLEKYEDTLRKVTELDIAHISAYSLIVEEGTPFFKLYEEDKLDLPDEETERQMYYRTKEILGAAGFKRYEISNYAKEGCECRHNVRYWRREDYLGLGLGASSCMENVRFKNTDWLDEYVMENKYMDKCEVQELSKEECMEEFMFLGLRMTKGVSKTKFADTFGVTMDKVYGPVLSKLKEQNLIAEEGDLVCLTEYGLDVSNRVWVEFLL